jgi:hypothetical protein
MRDFESKFHFEFYPIYMLTFYLITFQSFHVTEREYSGGKFIAEELRSKI